jgi:hypothetical protein
MKRLDLAVGTPEKDLLADLIESHQGMIFYLAEHLELEQLELAYLCLPNDLVALADLQLELEIREILSEVD